MLVTANLINNLQTNPEESLMVYFKKNNNPK